MIYQFMDMEVGQRFKLPDGTEGVKTGPGLAMFGTRILHVSQFQEIILDPCLWCLMRLTGQDTVTQCLVKCRHRRSYNRVGRQRTISRRTGRGRPKGKKSCGRGSR